MGIHPQWGDDWGLNQKVGFLITILVISAHVAAGKVTKATPTSSAGFKTKAGKAKTKVNFRNKKGKLTKELLDSQIEKFMHIEEDEYMDIAP